MTPLAVAAPCFHCECLCPVPLDRHLCVGGTQRRVVCATCGSPTVYGGIYKYTTLKPMKSKLFHFSKDALIAAEFGGA